MEERALVERILDGDQQAEHLLYDRHVDAVYRLAHRMARDAALAEELTQDTFLRAFDRLETWRGEAPFGAWLRSIAVSVVLNGLRGARRVKDHETPVAEPAPAASVAPDDGAVARLLDRAVAQLNDEHRLVFVMHDVEGYTHREIADSMGTPVGTAKARLSRARAALRAVIVQARPDLSLETGS